MPRAVSSSRSAAARLKKWPTRSARAASHTTTRMSGTREAVVNDLVHVAGVATPRIDDHRAGREVDALVVDVVHEEHGVRLVRHPVAEEAHILACRLDVVGDEQ